MARRLTPQQLAEIRQAGSPADLRMLASAVPEPQRSLFNSLANALERNDVDAIERIAAKLAGDRTPEQLQEVMASTMQAAVQELGGLQTQLEQASVELGGLEGIKAQLEDLPDQLEGEGLDPGIAEQLRKVFKRLGSETLGPMGSVLAESEVAVGALHAVAAKLAAGEAPEDVGVDDLRQRIQALEGVAQQIDPKRAVSDLLDVVALFRKASEEMELESEALELFLLEAALRQVVTGQTAPLSEWEEALQRAEALEAPRLGRQAAKVLQSEAISRGDYARVAELSEHMANFAEQTGDGVVQVLSLCEAALARQHAGDPEGANATVERAVQLAGPLDDARVAARSRLTMAQIFELQRQHGPAARIYLDLMETLQSGQGTDKELGRALLGAGRCWPDPDPQSEGRLEALVTARDLGEDMADATLYVPAVRALLQLCQLAGERRAAMDVLVPARGIAGRIGGPAAAGAIDQMAGELRSSWGPAVFDAELESFRERQAYRQQQRGKPS